MQKNEQQIISVSRRTDIPAYYSDWLRNRLESGFTYYQNPMSGQPVFIDLSPEKVKAFVFWTRNPKPLFKHLDFIDEKYEKRHYMHFTINGLPEILEKRNPKVDFAMESAAYLAERYGKNYLQWRFDPIIISSVTPVSYFIDKFDEISGKISGYTGRCYFSFVDLYQKTLRNIRKIEDEYNIKFEKQTLEEQLNLINKLKIIADSRNIKLYACAEDILLNVPGIEKAHCIDEELIKRVSENGNKKFRFVPSREGCGCIESRDIGYYDSCPHGCIYCYANMDTEKAMQNAKKYLCEGFPFDEKEPVLSDQLLLI